VPAGRLANMEAWAGVWYRWVAASFLREYVHAIGESSILPRRQDEVSKLLGVLVLEKAVYEVGYELNNRPDWLRIPLRGVIQEMASTSSG
jgi:predicted trehalose synthase